MALTGETAGPHEHVVGIDCELCARFLRVVVEPYAALTTFWDRRQRVQTRMRLMPPLIIARTFCRFGSKRLALTL
jgi:hypothetical protein